MKNKLLKLLTLVLLVIAMIAFSLACSNGDTSGTNGDNTANVEIQAIYDMYVAYAEENGVTPKSYEDWLNTIKGKDGLNGVGVKTATINADGELIVTLTDGKELNLGVVKGKDAPVNTLGLDFFPLDDGTYGVKAGNASYLSEIRIPATYDGKPVTKILDFFFGSSIRPTVKKIVIPEGVKVICDYAFENDYGQNPIESITIPKSVIEIGESAFDCEEDVKVYYNGTLEEWANIDFEDAWANPMYDGGELYVQGQKVENVDFSNKSINSYAFTGCKSLKSIKLPTNLTEITEYAFYNCSSLTSIEIPNSVTSIGDSAFSSCSSLTSIEIPASVESVGYGSFRYCTSLESVTISEKVESIGGSAFENCRALETINFNATACEDFNYGSPFDFAGQDGDGITVTFGNNVTKIPARIFYSYSYNNENRSPKITSVTIGEKVESIGYEAFYNCNLLTSIVIPNSVTSIGSQAFYNCYKLVEVYNKSSLNITEGNSDNGYIGYYALDVYIDNSPSKLTTDSNGYIIYTDGEDKILVGYKGSKIELNNLPSGITKMNQYAFYNSNITSIIIPNTVISIGERAFSGCDLLTRIIIPSSVTNIETWAFFGCGSLTIYCVATEKPSGWLGYGEASWNGSRPVVWGYTGE